MTDSSNGSMWVVSVKLESAFLKVRDVQEYIRQYVLEPNKLPVSVEDTQWAIEQKYQLNINKEEVDFEAFHIRGMLERYADGTANVFIRRSQDPNPEYNKFWQRFITVKELMHLAIDEEEDFSPDGCRTIEDLIAEHAFDGMRIPRDEIQSEVLAELAAIEILYPFEFRQADIDRHVALEDLAAEYEVPQYVIQRALQESYMKTARAVWNEIGGHGLGGIGSDPCAT